MNANARTTSKATDSTTHERVHRGRFRAFVVGLLGVLTCLAIGGYVVVHWAERQVFTTDNWVALVSPLPKQPVVSTALGTYISDQVFSAVPVQNEIAAALPPRAAFLAGPLTEQLQSLTTRTAQKVVASDGFQTVWEGANRLAMDRLLATARGQTPPLQAKLNEKFNLNISGANGQLLHALGSAGQAVPALQPAAHKVTELSADLQARPKRVQQAVRATDYLAAVLPWAMLAGLLGTLALSGYRRHTLVVLALSVIVLMLLELIGVKFLRQQTLDKVRNPANLDAVGYVYDTLVAWLKHMMYIVIGGMVVLIGLLLLAGPSDVARKIRTYVRLDRLKNTAPFRAWNSLRVWLGRWEYYFWVAGLVAVLASVAAFKTVTVQVITNAVLITLCLFAGLHIIATPPHSDKGRA